MEPVSNFCLVKQDRCKEHLRIQDMENSEKEARLNQMPSGPETLVFREVISFVCRNLQVYNRV